MTSNEYNECNCYCCETDSSSSIKKIVKDNPAITTGIVIGTALTAATIISPTVRKITVPTCKYLAKQQLKILAGIGLFSIATFISTQDDIIESNITNNDDILY